MNKTRERKSSSSCIWIRDDSEEAEEEDEEEEEGSSKTKRSRHSKQNIFSDSDESYSEDDVHSGEKGKEKVKSRKRKRLVRSSAQAGRKRQRRSRDSSESDSAKEASEEVEEDTHLRKIRKKIERRLDVLLSSTVVAEQKKKQEALKEELRRRNRDVVIEYKEQRKKQLGALCDDSASVSDLFPKGKTKIEKVEPLPRGCYWICLKNNFPVDIPPRAESGGLWDPKNDYILLDLADEFGEKYLDEIYEAVKKRFYPRGVKADPGYSCVARIRYAKLRPQNPPRSIVNITSNFSFAFCRVCKIYNCIVHAGFNSELDDLRVGEHLQRRGDIFRKHEKSDPCQFSCYKLALDKRDDSSESDDEVVWTGEEKALFAKSLETFGTNFCLIKLTLFNKTCAQVQRFYTSEDWNAFSDELDVERSKLLGDSEDREVEKATSKKDKYSYAPCRCVGSCRPKTCVCKNRNTPCEKFCSCHSKCSNRSRGCRCRGSMTCHTSKCPCNLNKRECDPDVCLSCDASCHPSELKGTRRCRNVHMLYGDSSKRTILGYSTLNVKPRMFGLFAGEDIKKHEFILEYTGKLYDDDFTDPDSLYIFDLIEKSARNENVVDAAKMGNKTRCINHSSENPNVVPISKFVNGVQRLGFYAAKDIKLGEELFFDYGSAYWKLLQVEPTEERNP